MLSLITIGINPIAIQLGPLSIHWYGVMYAIAFFVAYRFGAMPVMTRHHVAKAQLERILTATIIAGLIGARLYYVVQQPDLVSNFILHPLNIIAVWQGGMAFFGAIIGSLLTLLFFAWRERISFWVMLDAAAFFAVIGQPIGRIGNVVNGDILGSQSNAWFAFDYTYPTGFDHCAVLQAGFNCGVGYEPAAVYEALGTIAIGIVLWLLYRRHPAIGSVGIIYLGLYCVSQFLISFLRDSEPVIGLGLKQLQWTSLVGLIVGVPLVILARRRFPPTAGKDEEEKAESPPGTPAEPLQDAADATRSQA